jgi:hypothetical protein
MESYPVEVNIFPNPCSDHMVVRGKAGGHVQVIDLLGELVATQSLNETGELQLNTSDWPVGVYKVITKCQHEQVTKVVLVEH